MLILFLNEDFMTPYQFDQLMNLLGHINVNLQNLVDLKFADGLEVNTSEAVSSVAEDIKEITEVTIPLVKQEEKPLTKEELDKAWIDMKIKEMEANGIEADYNGVTVAEVKKRGRKKKNEQA